MKQALSAVLVALITVGCGRGVAPAPATSTPSGGAPSPGTTPTTRAEAPATTDAAAPPKVGLGVGDLAPDWTLETLGSGAKVRLSDLRGQVVLISFWASWCGPCKTELPALEAPWLARKDKGFNVVAISVDDRIEDSRAFLATTPVGYTTVWDPGGKVVSDPWQVLNLPMSFLIDRAGVIRQVHIGYTPRQLEGTLRLADALLSATPKAPANP